MALATMSNLWVPDVWIDGIRERSATSPAVFNSAIVVRTAEMDAIASGPGTSVNIPFFKDITEQDDEVQVENQAPTTTHGITSGKQVAAPMERQTKNQITAMAKRITGKNPVGEMLDMLFGRKAKQRQKTLLAMLRGLCGTYGARNAAAALSAIRLGGTTAEPFDETGLDATDDQKIGPDMFIDVKALFGQLQSELVNGLFFCHSNIKARLEKLDKDNFKDGRPSQLPFSIERYRDIPIVIDDALVRNADNGGYVYDSYLVLPGTVGYGEKPQVGGELNNPVADVASMNMVVDADKNNETLYDRSRFVMHVAGTKWKGDPAAETQTNAELMVTDSWELVYEFAKLCGVACFRTNG